MNAERVALAGEQHHHEGHAERPPVTNDSGSHALPDQPHELLRLALADLRKCAADPQYEVNMDKWHQPSFSTAVCEVCLAGAVMAQTLGVLFSVTASPRHFDASTMRKLFALDYLCSGQLVLAYKILNLQLPPDVPYITNPPEYDAKNPEPFFQAMNDLADMLEKHAAGKEAP